MVCLSAAVLTKQGKILIARQFVEMSRMKIENHLATFPKLVGTEKQHNTVETAEVRFVYQNVESLYLVIITNKQSNIVEDLETLRLFTKVLSEYCPGEVDEANVCKNAFELIFAFDEIIALGHREPVSMRDIQVNMEMESHEEKLATMIRQSKEREAQEEMKRKVREMSKDKRAKGIGGGGMGAVKDFAEDMARGNISLGPTDSASSGMIGGGSASFGMSPTPSSAPMLKPKKGEGGMQLGKPKGGLGGALGGASLLQAMVDDGEVLPSKTGGVPEPSPTSAAAGASIGKAQPVTLTCDEKLVIALKRDGGLQSMEIKGDLQLLVTDPNYGKAIVPLKLGANPGFQFKTHPNINKQLFASSSQIGLKDPAKPFPSNQSLGVVKWRLQTSEESMVPLLVTCWPSQTAGDAWDVTLEYELTKQLELHDLLISIPIPAEVSHSISNAEVGQATYSRREGALQWHIPMVDSGNASATIEFSVSGAPSADAIFPISISFSSRKTLCEMEIPDVLSAEDNTPLPFALTTLLSVESYTIS